LNYLHSTTRLAAAKPDALVGPRVPAAD